MYLYRADLEVRLGKVDAARSSLAAAVDLPLSARERAQVAKDFAYVTELLGS